MRDKRTMRMRARKGPENRDLAGKGCERSRVLGRRFFRPIDVMNFARKRRVEAVR